MILLQSIILLCLLLLVISCSNFDFFSPSFYFILGFFIISISSSIIFFTSGNDVDVITLFIIVSTLFVFFISEFITSNLVQRRVKRRTIVYNPTLSCCSEYFLGFVAIVSLVTISKQVDNMLSALMLFSTGNADLSLGESSRYCAVHPEMCSDITIGVFGKVGLILTKATTYILALVYLLDKKTDVRRSKIVYCLSFIIVVAFLVQTVLSTNRSIMIYFFIYLLVLWTLVEYHFKRNFIQFYLSFIRKSFFAFSVLAMFFYFSGFLTNKTQGIDFYTIFIGYTGLQLFAFSEFVLSECNGMCASTSHETFISIQGFLIEIGILETFSKVNLPTVNIDVYATNVYTAFRRTISDYGYFFHFVFYSILGGAYGILYGLVKKRPSLFIVSLYSFLMFPLFFSAWEEKFTNSVITLATFIHFVLVYFLLYLKVRK